MFLPKNRSERLLKDTPGPFYLDLRPKKVDLFLKKYDLRRKGTTFNLVMDRRQLNLVGRILDPLGPLSQLWESSLNAKKRSIGLDPALVTDCVRRAIFLVGNASYCVLW